MAPAFESGHASIARTILKSPVGPLGLVSRDEHLAAIMFLPQPKMLPYLVERTYGDAGEESSAPFAQPIEQLEEYFAGRRLVFRLPLDLDQGTPFQRRVWKALLDIPYGTTVTYKDVAAAIGQPSAVRAVGSANGSNPIPIVVPCHRVIAAGGKIGGYGGGIPVKTKLLDIETRTRLLAASLGIGETGLRPRRPR
jgi:O-6-methylguanine DNA methyltransferase